MVSKKDKQNKPIKLSAKFIKTKKKIPTSKVDEIKIKALKTGKKRKVKNRKNLRILKNRKKMKYSRNYTSY